MAGMMPSSCGELLERGERLGVGDRLVAHEALVLEVRVLRARRPDSRVRREIEYASSGLPASSWSR